MSVRLSDAEQMRADHAIRMQAIVEEHGLTPEDIARMGTMDPNDEISVYAGHPAVQAAMIADEKEQARRATETAADSQASIEAIIAEPFPDAGRVAVESWIELGYN